MLCDDSIRRLICASVKRHPLTAGEQGAVVLGTAVPVINAVAIADAQAVLGTKQPHRLLHQTREKRRAVGTKLASVDVLSGLLDDAGAPAWPVTSRSIGVLGPKATKMPVRCSQLCTSVSTAVMLAPSSPSVPD